ncbi:hypothetical protein [Pseudomaricurvus alkylphenolicus]|uniref:hypothetical protein n=1 Tax=Pseudomaricurvus alkylphenolicus TaxID=1306991 RepID=UPI00197FC774|nr:hypothetical protein [Pseudomaricurvus alkylphenolicus]
MRTYLAPVIAITHRLVANRMRAMASAILFFIINIIGLGLGPLLVGMVSDLLSASLGSESLRYSLLIFCSISTGWAGLHFYLGARHLPVDLDRQQAPEAGEAEYGTTRLVRPAS